MLVLVTIYYDSYGKQCDGLYVPVIRSYFNLLMIWLCSTFCVLVKKLIHKQVNVIFLCAD